MKQKISLDQIHSKIAENKMKFENNEKFVQDKKNDLKQISQKIR